MDDEMINICAKAICLTHWTDDSRYKKYIPAVKAVIKAMREPTPKMWDAMDKAYQSPACMWMAGIDAILND
jgi:hypothetical protein